MIVFTLKVSEREKCDFQKQKIHHTHDSVQILRAKRKMRKFDRCAKVIDSRSLEFLKVESFGES